jgi:hypothetical protein
MNGYYGRRSCLPYEEIRPLEIDEIEFVIDVRKFYEEEVVFDECTICGEEAIYLDDCEEACCSYCQYLIEN